MIMSNRVPCRLQAGAKLFVVLLAMAALPAWTLGQGKPEVKPELKKTEVKDYTLDIEIDPLTGVEGGVFRFVSPDVLFLADVPGADDKKIKELEEKLAELNKQLKALKERRPTGDVLKLVAPLRVDVDPKGVDGKVRIWSVGPDGKAIETTPAFGREGPKPITRPLPPPGWKIVGADGKEIKDAKLVGPDGKEIPTMAPGQRVLWSYPAAAATPAAKLDEARKEITLMLEKLTGAELNRKPADGAPNTIALSRTTYKLSKDKAESLGAFLKSNVKASVLELKVEEEGLTVTTTPETQSTVAGIVKLMQK